LSQTERQKDQPCYFGYHQLHRFSGQTMTPKRLGPTPGFSLLNGQNKKIWNKEGEFGETFSR